MKKMKLCFTIVASSIVLINCNSAKKTTETYVPVEKKVSYNTDIKPIIENSCTPCHFPPKGKKEPLENYTHVKEHISNIITRVKLTKDDRRFMPPKNKKPALNDSLIAVLVKWQKQNMPE